MLLSHVAHAQTADEQAAATPRGEAAPTSEPTEPAAAQAPAAEHAEAPGESEAPTPPPRPPPAAAPSAAPPPPPLAIEVRSQVPTPAQSTEGAETRGYWQTDKFSNADGWLQLGVAYSWFFNPVLRYKSPGSDDFHEPGSILGPPGGTMSESSSTLALSVGMLKSFLRYLAVGAFVTVYVPASLEDADGSFDHYEATMGADTEDAYTVESTETVHFDEMSVGLAFLDLQLHVAPHPPLPASLYLAGHIGSIFYDYRVGTHEDGDNESTLGYGVGLRLFPVRHVSAVLEFRRIGILTMETTDCGDAEYYVENCDPEKTGTFDASVWMNTVSIGLIASFY